MKGFKEVSHDNKHVKVNIIGEELSELWHAQVDNEERREMPSYIFHSE